MKHADVRALEAVSDLIENLRRRSDLVEKKLGIFYTKGRALLHFIRIPLGSLPICGKAANGNGSR